jgi:hypothetical protein
LHDPWPRERIGYETRVVSPPRSRSRRLETLLLVAFVVLVVAAFLLMLAGLLVLILAL